MSSFTDLRAYIHQTWATLTRSNQDLLASAQDPKLDHTPGTPWLVYVSPQEDPVQIDRNLHQVLQPEELRQIELRILPQAPDQIQDHGLLYLPYPYIVPGGRFNEMYGWDSFFIQLGLLREAHWNMARNLVDQLIYEIEHYGTILNANRTYFLTRSQPPFLTPMICGVYHHTQDREWLASTLGAIADHYRYWTAPPHLHEPSRLSRYFDLGSGPAPEVLSSERDAQGRSHYDRIQNYYRHHSISDYDLSLYYDRDRDYLTDLFYKGDRSMRESGFDPSNRFGPLGIDVLHYLPVCLNTLLYQMEQDTAEIYRVLGQPEAAQPWQIQAQKRQQRINDLLWDQEAGLYFDYNFRTGQRRPYEFATTFYPLWAGIASPAQAGRMVENLSKFEAAGGLLTSTQITGNQWDAPFGWAPLQWIAVQGLHRYGYEREARRIAQKFVNLVAQEFGTQGTIVEKYDVIHCHSQVSEAIQFGYSSNEIGFGWTNGVVLDFLAMLES